MILNITFLNFKIQMLKAFQFMTRFCQTIIFIGFLSAFVMGSYISRGDSQEKPYHIVTTTTQIGDLLKNIVGNRATVTSILGPQIDPHLYRLTRTDIALLLNADMIIYNGLFLEGKMEVVFDRLISQNEKPIYAIGDLISPSYLLHPDNQNFNQYDPHIWNNVLLWREATLKLADKLCNYDPKGCSIYTKNAKTYAQTLNELDHYLTQIVKTIPESNRILITAHDAFNYLGHSYGIEVIGLQGISTDSETGLNHINQLVSLIIDKKIKAIFIETSISDRSIKALIEGVQSTGHPLKIGGALYSDAMGPSDSPAGTYIGMMEHNMSTIVTALGGYVPAAGFSKTRLAKSTSKSLQQK